jgi:TRAP-type C4-dicarboxylate transport system permease small subunit
LGLKLLFSLFFIYLSLPSMRLNLWLLSLKILAGLAGLVLSIDILLIAAEVLFRNLGLAGMGWVSDIVEYSLPLATLLVAPWLVSSNGHVRLDLMVERLGAQSRRRLFRLTMLVAGTVSSVLVYASTMLVMDTYQSGALVMKSLVFPEWWVMAAVPPLFLLVALECLRNALGTGEPSVAGGQS